MPKSQYSLTHIDQTYLQIFKAPQELKLANPWKIPGSKESDKKKKPEEAKNSKSSATKTEPASTASSGPPSNLSTFLHVVSDLLSYFESTQKSIEKSNARIVEKYPNFLSKLALFSLQMDDSIFRETFMVQIIIFAQALADPVGLEQRNSFQLGKDEAALADKVRNKAIKLLTQTDQSPLSPTSLSKKNKKANMLRKRTFGESLIHIVERNEPQWASWKKDGCLSFEVR